MQTDKEFMRALVYGTAVGDAFGVPFEFMERGTFRCGRMMSGWGTHRQPPGTWSDDTSLTLATVDSLLKQEKVDVWDMRSRFEDFAFDGRYTPRGEVFDIGTTTSWALRGGKGLSDERSCGNGSLMRIAPLAATDATDEEIAEASAITHANPLCMELCVAFVGILRAVSHDPKSAWEHMRTDGEPPKSGGYVRDTYDAALWCFGTTGCYEDCVIAAVNLGGDTDTTAAVAGALAVACYGEHSIPQRWVDALESPQVIVDTLEGWA